MVTDTGLVAKVVNAAWMLTDRFAGIAHNR
jgi:hypothetical protein